MSPSPSNAGQLRATVGYRGMKRRTPGTRRNNVASGNNHKSESINASRRNMKATTNRNAQSSA